MSTNSETINKSWQKTLTGGFEFDEELLGNPDYREELLLQLGMEKLMLQDGVLTVTTTDLEQRFNRIITTFSG